MEESVRPCLRCDELVEGSHNYCPRCGNYLDKLKLVIPRTGAGASVEDHSGTTVAFQTCVAGAALFAMASLLVTAWALLAGA